MSLLRFITSDFRPSVIVLIVSSLFLLWVMFRLRKLGSNVHLLNQCYKEISSIATGLNNPNSRNLTSTAIDFVNAKLPEIQKINSRELHPFKIDLESSINTL